MRFLAVLFLAVLVCINAETPVVPELQPAHVGFCPMYGMMCAIYCPPASFLTMVPRQIGGCRGDSECAVDEKCCRPSCGCTNRCTKATTTWGFPKFPK